MSSPGEAYDGAAKLPVSAGARLPRLRSSGQGVIARYVGVRLAQGLLVVFGAALIGFVVTNLTGNAASVLGGGFLGPAQVRALAHQLGYDQPVLQRFGTYLTHAVSGNFGTSYRLSESASSLVLHALPYTLALVVGATAIALLVSVPASMYSVLHRDRPAESVLRHALLFCQGMPEFFLALLLVLVFSVQLDLLPSIGYQGPRSLVLPAVALSVPVIPGFFRLLRGELIELMDSEFILAARSKGISERAIVRRHALRNAMPPFITYVALQLGWLMGGTLIVEVVFGLPGVGTVLYQSVQTRDIVVIQAVVILLAVTYVGLNLLADLVVLWIDPRVRTSRA